MKIIPLHVGTLIIEKSIFTPRRDFGVQFAAPSIIWYIEGAEKKILVDTSFRDAKASSRVHAPHVVERNPDQEIEAALAKIGLKPDQIDIVVMTHLHWDHCQNNPLFKKAKFLIQAEELRYAISPLPPHRASYEALTAGMRPYWLDTPNIQVVEGDRKIVEGVSIIYTPSHSPAHQSVMVETKAGNIVITGDIVFTYQNWGSSELGTHIPGASYVNLEDYWRSLQKIERLASLILPSHDPAVFNKSEYP